VLRTHIANLRAKLAPGVQGPPPIRTDPGIGYRFIS
jgi:DNA-binding response OmpR family regulator